MCHEIILQESTNFHCLSRILINYYEQQRDTWTGFFNMLEPTVPDITKPTVMK